MLGLAATEADTDQMRELVLVIALSAPALREMSLQLRPLTMGFGLKQAPSHLAARPLSTPPKNATDIQVRVAVKNPAV